MDIMLQVLMIFSGSSLILNSLINARRYPINTGIVMPTVLGLPMLAWSLLRGIAVSMLPSFLIKFIDYSLLVAYAAFTLSFLIIIWLIWRAPSPQAPAATDALIVLGALLKGNEVSHTLDLRLRRSAEIMRQHPRLKVVVSGGQSAGATRTEASAMAEHLVRIGINPERIIIEDKSLSTSENLNFCLPLLEKELGHKPHLVTIVTSDYHVFRALLLAKASGYNAIGIAAPTPRGIIFNNLLREYVAIIRYLLLGY